MIFKYEQSLVSPEDIKKSAEELSGYRQYLEKVDAEDGYLYDESSVNLPSDKEQLSLIKKTLQGKITDALSVVLLIGIGGSNLGAKAVYDALLGAYDALDTRVPKIIFAETNDPEYELHIEKSIKEKVLNPENILVLVVTKSGTTKETILNKDRIIKILSDAFSFDAIKDRLVFITGEETPLWREAKEKGIGVISIPEKVGGRFSVFSAVGLAPLFASGIDIQKLLDGAELMKKRCLSDDVEDNVAMISASILFSQYEKGFNIHDSFFFEMELESLGKWYRQLLAESIGKRENEEGSIIQTGITPTISIGTQDLHSVLELNIGGPKDKLTTFISTSVKNEGEEDYKIAMQSAYQNTRESYIKNKLPFTEIILPDLSEFYLGQYMQFKMLEVMYIGKLLGINPFVQPSVEEYKKESQI